MNDSPETEEWYKDLKREERKRNEEYLAARKAEAERIGKELFNMDKLLLHRKYKNKYDRADFYEDAKKDYEWRYYSFKRFMTLKEFAESLDEAFLYGHD
jgi:hypothetical protein